MSLVRKERHQCNKLVSIVEERIFSDIASEDKGGYNKVMKWSSDGHKYETQEAVRN